MRKTPPKVNAALKVFWLALDQKQRTRFAKLAGKTPGSMVQTVYGRRSISPDLAIRIEGAASRMGTELSRTKLNDTCRRCEFARACLGLGNGAKKS